MEWPTVCHSGDIFSNLVPDHIGTRDCKTFRNKILRRHSSLSRTLSENYLKIYHEKSLREANLFLGRIDQSLVIDDLNLSASLDDIKEFCLNKSRQCRDKAIEYRNSTIALELCNRIISKYGIEPFEERLSIKPALNRMSCPDWWFKRISKIRLSRIEETNRQLGVVHKGAQIYASELSVEARRVQIMNSFHYLASRSIVNEKGQEFTLLDIYKKSVSNPFVRKAELMTRIRGFEEVAEILGHQGEFYTLTAPSKYHPYSNGKPNPKYQNYSVAETQAYFNNLWSLIRSALQKRQIQIYGFRVVEPHHDGTPHWHLLLFMDPKQVKTARSVMRKYALKTDGNERGAKEHRFKAIEIDPAKGSASGYIAKYITKNVDGVGLNEDLYGLESTQAASRINAWAASSNIRQFQQIGGPSVSVWRELRRLQGKVSEELEPARLAADASDWASFVMTMGGPTIPRRCRPIQPFYEIKQTEEIDRKTGEISFSSKTRYGDEKLPSIKGLAVNNKVYSTRLYSWQIIKEPMTFCNAKPEHCNTELASGLRWRDPPTREGPPQTLGLV